MCHYPNLSSPFSVTAGFSLGPEVWPFLRAHLPWEEVGQHLAQKYRILGYTNLEATTTNKSPTCMQ